MDELISKQAAIDLWDKYHNTIAVDAMQYDAELRELPPAQPEIIDGRLFVTVDDIEKVGCVLVDEHKSNFCRQFWMDGDGPVQCEDAVSREAVLDALRTCYDTETITYDNGDEYIHYGDAVGEVEQLPPAQPERIKGHWIEIINSRNVVVALRCSRCEKSPRHGARSDFCPNCGAKMKPKGKE